MGNVGTLCVEPRVAVAFLWEMLAPFQGAGRLEVLLKHRPVEVVQARDMIQAVTVEDLRTGVLRTITADVVIDATETGELLGLSNIEQVRRSRESFRHR